MSKSFILFYLHKPWQLDFPRISRWIAFSAVAACMTFLASSRALAQDSTDQQQSQQDSQNATAPPQRDQRRVISRDKISQKNQDAQADADRHQDQDQGQSMENAPPPERRPAPDHRPYPRSRATGNVPDDITVPAGKIIFVRLNEPLSSDHSHAGDGFTATLDQPIVINGWVVARRGETVYGAVTAAKKAGRVKGVSELGLELSDITIVDGQQLPLVTELWSGSAGTSHGSDAAGIATTTGVGTIIGAAANGGEGAGIGAGAGAVAGIAMVLLTRGKPTVLGPEARLSFRLKEPITISTENSRQAFQPVGPNDYNASPSLRHRGGGYAVAYPYPGYYPGCAPYWGCGPYSYYPAFGFAYYGGYYGRFHHGSGHFGHGEFRR